MRYETVQYLSDEAFKRSTGVQRSTFTKLLEAVEQKLGQFGRPPKLSRADQLLLTLMYCREYRSEFHLSLAYGAASQQYAGQFKRLRMRLFKRNSSVWPGEKASNPLS